MCNINLNFHQRADLNFDVWQDGKRRFTIRKGNEIFSLSDEKKDKTYTVCSFLHAVDLIFGFIFNEDEKGEEK